MSNSDEKKQGPLGPIVRKAKSPSEEVVETPSAEPAAETPSTEPAPVEAVAPVVEAAPVAAVAEAPQLSRRVVDVVKEAPKPKKKPAPVVETTVEQGSMEDFEALMAGAEAAPTRVRISVGDKIDGYVAKIGDRYIYVELPGGAEGMAERRDFEDKDGALQIGEGETVSFYVVNMRGGIQLGTKMSTAGGALDALEQAFATGIPVEGTVASKNKGGYDVEVQGVRCFCPLSQIEIAYTEDPEVHIGKTYRFRVSKFDEDGRNVLVSRSALQKEEREAQAEVTLKSLEPGVTVEGTVTRLADFGAFVELGGVEGLIHISELAYTRVEHPSEAVQVDEIVKVKVLSIEDSPKGPRISLSIRQTLSDPWDTKIDDFVEGSKVEGTVTRTEIFGAFVEIAPGLEGLVHISEMSWEKHVKRPTDVVHVGEKVMVEIQSIDRARQRIGLSMKGSASDPWTNISERFAEGLEVEGEVENLEDFGIFVRLSGGVTALVPRSEMDLPRDATPHRKFKVGDTVTARVLSIEPERRRMALTMRSREDVEATNEMKSAPRTYAEPSGTGFSTFGDLLKDKLK